MIYYSGALEPDKVQNNPAMSLGGFKSSSQIANGEIHNLFPKIDKEEVLRNKKRTRLIILHNITGKKMENIKIWTDGGDFFITTIGVIEPHYNEKCDKYSFEKLTNESHLPYQTQLEEHDEENKALVITELEKNKMLGIWIRRELDLTQFTDDELSDEDIEDCELIIEKLEKELEDSSKIKEEDKFDLHVSWD